VIAIEHKWTQPCRGLSKLEEKVEGQSERLNKLELATNNNEDSIKDLSVSLSKYETMAHNRIGKIDNLENRLFSFLTAFTNNQSKEESEWKELIKWVIGATIVLAVGYIFGKGGVK